MTSRISTYLALAALATALAGPPAAYAAMEEPAAESTTTETPAADGAAEDATKPPVASETTTECTDGKVFDAEKKECLDPKESGLSDDLLFKAARELAYAGQYEHTLKVLDAVKDQESARVLNYRGYANRKAGRMELGMQYYKRALQADENYILARSYMGQALIQQGQIEEAKVQLIEIRDRGGEKTWAYRALLESLGGVRQY